VSELFWHCSAVFLFYSIPASAGWSVLDACFVPYDVSEKYTIQSNLRFYV
jgi:hypothetical protein